MSYPPKPPEAPQEQPQEQAAAQQPYAPQPPYPTQPPYTQPYPPQYGGQYGAAGPTTSGLAITGFVLSLLVPLTFWIPFINLIAFLGNLAGFIISIVAVNQIKNSNGQLGGKGLAVAGIILSCVWFGLLLLFFVFAIVVGVSLFSNLNNIQDLQNLRSY